MGDYPRAACVLALFVFGGLADACQRHVITTPDPPAPTRWVLSPEADDADRFCVPTPYAAGTDPRDVLALRCTSVGDVRRYVRMQRWAP